ncbi:hypothetical protein NLJ89_g6494 [Agrocybe chaxingu]|uniref:CBM1 domain-containing protein n=1 Tax=Agrocybe chaxingu TaxID=84603 RepID=A0A9W8JYI5_9AGAR|nr:hypothetical protein NLJ89_g6494 [Agrocybe chaxingu]
MKPLSRGTVLLEPRRPLRRALGRFQRRTLTPRRPDILVATIKFFRRWMAAPSMQQLTPVEQTPGASLTSDAQLANYLTTSMGASTAHSCCTAAMAPEEQAGVVSADLTVYGVTGLSVGDISLIPIIPATHTCATVYAIAEKAADLIKARYDPSIPPPPTTPGTTTLPVPTTTTTNPQPTQPPSCTVSQWGQCGGQGYTGCTTCAAGSTCTFSNNWYSQCL